MKGSEGTGLRHPRRAARALPACRTASGGTGRALLHPHGPGQPISGNAESQGGGSYPRAAGVRGGGRTRGQLGSRRRSARRRRPRSPHRRSAASPSTAASSAERSRPTSCPGSCLCSWTVHRAQSVCKGQRKVRATSGRTAPASLLGSLARACEMVGLGVDEAGGAVLSQELVSTPSPALGEIGRASCRERVSSPV